MSSFLKIKGLRDLSDLIFENGSCFFESYFGNIPYTFKIGCSGDIENTYKELWLFWCSGYCGLLVFVHNHKSREKL